MQTRTRIRIDQVSNAPAEIHHQTWIDICICSSAYGCLLTMSIIIVILGIQADCRFFAFLFAFFRVADGTGVTDETIGESSSRELTRRNHRQTQRTRMSPQRTGHRQKRNSPQHLNAAKVVNSEYAPSMRRGCASEPESLKNGKIRSSMLKEFVINQFKPC